MKKPLDLFYALIVILVVSFLLIFFLHIGFLHVGVLLILIFVYVFCFAKVNITEMLYLLKCKSVYIVNMNSFRFILFARRSKRTEKQIMRDFKTQFLFAVNLLYQAYKPETAFELETWLIKPQSIKIWRKLGFQVEPCRQSCLKRKIILLASKIAFSPACPASQVMHAQFYKVTWKNADIAPWISTGRFSQNYRDTASAK